MALGRPRVRLYITLQQAQRSGQQKKKGSGWGKGDSHVHMSTRRVSIRSPFYSKVRYLCRQAGQVKSSYVPKSGVAKSLDAYPKEGKQQKGVSR